MQGVMPVFKREFIAYFDTPVAAVFIFMFLFFSALSSFYLGGLFERNQADMQVFFSYLPWIFLLLIPVLSMRLWAEERSSGSIELLMTLPITITDIVIGKFLAAWAVASMALLLCTNFWLLLSWLGSPDHGALLSGFVGSTFLAGSYLAIGSAVSALSRNQISAMLITMAICLLFLIVDLPVISNVFGGIVPGWSLELISQFSFLRHFQSIAKGVLDIRDILFFVLTITAWLWATKNFISNDRSG